MQQPASSVTLKPGPERGLPWGRDLFTFVTSAAGHVMRILQKPRKKRPSKRQVNHRRFLHNMIQRKFADIEAANHRLASALFSTEEENRVTVSGRVDSTPQGASQSHPHTDAVSDALKDTERASKSGSEASKTNQSKSGHHWTRNLKCHSGTYTDKGTHKYAGKKGSGDHKPVEIISLSSPERVNVPPREEHIRTGHGCSHESPPEAAIQPPQGGLCSWTDCDSLSKIIPLSHGRNLDTCDSPSLSLELSLSLSPLSLDSWDFSLQDIPACSQTKKDTASRAEGQCMDETFLLESDVEDGDLLCCADDAKEAYVDAVRACRGDGDDARWGVAGGTSTDGHTCSDQPEIFGDKMMPVHSRNGYPASEAGHSEGRGLNYGYGRGYSCHGDGERVKSFCGDVGETISHPLCHQEQQDFSHCRMASERQETTEIDMSCFESTHCEGDVPNQLPTSETYRYDIFPDACMYHQVPQQQQESRFAAALYGAGTPKKNVLFEGVAQSFSVPPQYPQCHPIITLPLQEDWLFTDILEDRRSPE